MIKNIIFDIGNVILNFDLDRVLNNITGDSSEQKFIMDYIYYGFEDESDYIHWIKMIAKKYDLNKSKKDVLVYYI